MGPKGTILANKPLRKSKVQKGAYKICQILNALVKEKSNFHLIRSEQTRRFLFFIQNMKILIAVRVENYLKTLC